MRGFLHRTIAGRHSEGVLLGAAAIGLVGVSLVWDIVRAPHSARVHNDQLRNPPRFGVAPWFREGGVGFRAEVVF